MTKQVSTPEMKQRLDRLVRETIGDPELLRKHYAELEKAGGRIGRTSIQVMRWLLDFSQRDLENLSLGDLTNVAYEAAFFAIFGLREKQSVSPFDLLAHDRSKAGWAASITPRHTVPNRLEVLDLQAQIRQHLEQLIDGGGTLIRLPNLEARVAIGKAGKGRAVGQLILSYERIAHQFLHHLLGVLVNHAPWVRRCKECERRFLAVRRKQKFCSARCQRRIATRRYRATLKKSGPKRRRANSHKVGRQRKPGN